MADIEIAKKEIEDKLFAFIEENFGKKRYEYYNEVVNFTEDKIFPTLINCNDETDGYIEDLEIENSELENRVDALDCAFDNLKNDSLEGLDIIKLELENIIKPIELDSVMDKKLKELKKVIENQHRIIANADDF
jgi:hypothetical protein